MAVRITLCLAVVATLVGTAWLLGWNGGYDVGYGAAMADNFLDVKTAGQYFQELIDAGRGVSH